jgi:hypothetical protein
LSIALVNSEISKFLESKAPEVLCVRGKWGVGKTYAWTKQLEQAQAASNIALPRYSYVSLFGVNSLDELKLSIFENVLTLSDGQLKADLNTLDSFVNSNLGQWRKLTRLVQSIPFVRSFIGGDAPALLSFLTIRDQIVCFDDLERRGQRLDIGDVLGLVSFLREQRACKAVLILNDEALTGEAKERFETYLEKVVDVSLVYEPTATESVGIALQGRDPVSQRIAELCTSLGISNIRVIKKIERVVHAIQPMLAKFDEEVFRQAASSLVLFCWSHDQPGEAPTLEFLTTKKAKNVFGLQKDENLPANEAAWNALLEAYGYTWTDEFDLALIEGVRDGYFDPAEIAKHAQELHDKVIATKADGSFEDAWRLYHDSFADNHDEVLDAIYASFMKTFRYITPLNLNGTVTLFKDLGRQGQAAEMLKHYVENRTEPRSFFDLAHYPFSGDITDPDVKQAFAEKCAALEEKLDVPAMLLALKDSWSDEVLAELSTLPIEEYRKAFKGTNGKDLRKMLAGVLQFDRIVNASAEMKEISRRAREALKLIGAESPINARRVGKFGIDVGAPADDAPAEA